MRTEATAAMLALCILAAMAYDAAADPVDATAVIRATRAPAIRQPEQGSRARVR